MTKKIPFVDLAAQYQRIQPDIDAAIQSIISRTAFIGGQSVKDFEAAFADYCGVPYAVGVGNGTDALVVALKSVGLQPGDEVITVSHTFIATAEAITQAAGVVKFVEIDPHTYTLDPAALEQAITERTKAIIPVHLYGQMADMDSIMALAKQHGLWVIEDAAQAHGATYKGQKAGTIGHLGAFSFYPGKNLGAYGDAGAIITRDENLARQARMMANHGRLTKYEHEFEGLNSRLDGLQAAVLSAKLPHLDTWISERRQVAAWYDEGLAPFQDQLTLPALGPHRDHVYHLYVIQVPERDLLLERLKANQIAGGIHYPVPLHEQPAYRYLNHAPDDFPITHQVAANIVSLPMFPELTQAQCQRVVQVVGDHIQALKGLLL